MPRLPPALLEAFVAVAQAGNLTRAADGMHLTVSALSHRMRQLESLLGCRLLVRGPRGVSLTADGQRLFGTVAGPLGDIEHALRRFRARDGGRLTLSLVPLVASGWLVPRLPGFVARHPDIAINLQSTTALVDFEREDVDAALRLGRGGWPGLHAERLFEESATPVASPALLARLGPVTEATLGDAPLLGDPDTRPGDHAEHWRPWFARHGGAPPTRYVASFDNSETLHQAAVQGLGITLGRLTLAQPLIDAGLLVRISRKRIRMQYAHWLVYPPRSVDHAGFMAFRDWLHGQLARTRPPLHDPHVALAGDGPRVAAVSIAGPPPCPTPTSPNRFPTSPTCCRATTSRNRAPPTRAWATR